MTSSRSWQKRSDRALSEIFAEEISAFDIFHHLMYMSATAAAGISRSRLFDLARRLPAPTAKYFKEIYDLAEHLRYNYPDACRLVGERMRSEHMRTFLFRFSDALRSGEPLSSFLAREAQVQGENYSNEYERRLDSLNKWNDGYTAVTVSVALIVIINIVSTLIYNVGPATTVIMVLTAISAGFGVAYVLSRAAPQEVKHVPLIQGCLEQRRTLRLFRVLAPTALVVSLALLIAGLNAGWVMIVGGVLLFPAGMASLVAERKIDKMDAEVSSFFRSLGGTATSRGTTLTDALINMEMDSFPALETDIERLSLRLNAFGKPDLCWRIFGRENGSQLIEQSVGIFQGAISLGGDPEKTGVLASLFAMKTAMLRAKRRGISDTFSWLTITMHTVLAALMFFLLEIINQFVLQLETSMAELGGGEEALQSLALNTFTFGRGHVQFLEQVTIGMVIMLTMVNAFAVVASEGSHLLKMSFYTAILLVLSGICYLIAPSGVVLIM